MQRRLCDIICGVATLLCGIAYLGTGAEKCPKSVFILQEGNTSVSLYDKSCNSTSAQEVICFTVASNGTSVTLTFHEEYLSRQKHFFYVPQTNESIRPSKFYRNASDHTKETFILTNPNGRETTCETCKNPLKKPDRHIHVPSKLDNSTEPISPATAVEAMQNLSILLALMENATTAAISMGEVKGLLSKLPEDNPQTINYGFSPTKEMSIVEGEKALQKEFNNSVSVSQEAVKMAVNKSGQFVGVLIFPRFAQDKLKSPVMNNEVIGIEMGARIHNLTETIDIHYRNVDRKEVCNGGSCIFTCNSWDGQGELNWTTDGCETQYINNNIKCSCTHLTFFAILMSQPGVISSSDIKNLTFITYIGCGLSLFFLGVALFMHFAMRSAKSSQAIKILFSLFISMFFLNFAFLLNETISGLNQYGACVAIAAAMHYFLLSTFTWFFLVAFHIFLQFRQLHIVINHYLLKISIAGWVTPAIVVMSLIISEKYVLMVINVDDGSKVKMCWIPDGKVHNGVNIGYYSLIFIFNLVLFIIVVRQIQLLRNSKTKETKSSTCSNFLTIFGLFFMLGISWGFAFFSYGPMTIPSYYIFTILNSFQGFFLFIYYYKTSNSNIIGEQAISSFSSKTKENPYEDTGSLEQ